MGQPGRRNAAEGQGQELGGVGGPDWRSCPPNTDLHKGVREDLQEPPKRKALMRKGLPPGLLRPWPTAQQAA